MKGQKAKHKHTPGELSRRFFKTQVLSVSVILLIFTLAYASVNAMRLHEQIENRIDGISRLAETSLTTAVWQVDHASVRDFVDALFLDKSIVYVSVITDERNMIERTAPQCKGMDFQDLKNNPSFLTRSVEISKFSEWIGSFRVAVTLESIRHEIFVNTAISLALSLVLIIAISLINVIYTRRNIFKRLTNLSSIARSIADGDMENAIETEGTDEIDELARALEDMRHSLISLIENLRDANVKLRNQSATLEGEVRERTKELEAKNHSLNIALKDASDARLQSETANKAKSEFLAGMSHEIRTPMNAILGMAESLSETGLDETQQEYVEVLRHAGKSLLTIIDDILDLSRVESGRMELESIDFNLAHVVDQAVAQAKAKAQPRGLSINAEISPQLPAIITGDPTRIGQILNNLLDNAIKFTHEGFVSLTVEPADRNGRSMLISVSDTGIGIAANKLATIFESFTQADGSTTREYGGTGLGLSICRKLVELMGGRIWAESQQDKGTTFFFNIPLQKQNQEQATTPLPPPNLSTKDWRILLVEDSQYNTFVVRTYLKDTACSLRETANGKEGLDAFRNEEFDLVIMDMQMPVMDGFTAMRKIREYERETGKRKTPILAMTAHALADEAKQCLDAGADMHLPKPVLKHQLIGAIKTLCSGHQAIEIPLKTVPAQNIPPEIAAIAPKFLENMRRELRTCRTDALRGDMVGIRHFLHKLRGEAGSFGFPELEAVGRKMHKAARADDIETVAELLPELEQLLSER